MKKNRGTTLMLSLLVFSLALLGWLIFDLRDRLVVAGKLRQEVVDRSELINSVDDLRVEFALYEPLVNDWEQWLPSTEEDVAVFAAEVERQAAGAGVSLEMSFGNLPEQTDVGGKYLEGLAVEFELVGSYQEVSSFVRDLGQIKYFIRLDKMLITKSQSEGGVNMIIEGVLLMR